MPHRRGTDVTARGDLPDREPLFNEGLKPVQLDAAAWRVARGVPRAQAVLVDPVRDGRGGAAGLARDRLDRAAFGEQRGERFAVHFHTNTSSCGGRNQVSLCRILSSTFWRSTASALTP